VVGDIGTKMAMCRVRESQGHTLPDFDQKCFNYSGKRFDQYCIYLIWICKTIYTTHTPDRNAALDVTHAMRLFLLLSTNTARYV
jgi:hypothetical protein